MSVLKFKNVSKNYCNKGESLEVLKDIEFELKEGQIIAITGPSGSGKTTILNLISGLLKPSKGKIETNGEIGYMFQRDHLFEWRTVYDNVILGLEIKKKLNEENIKKVNRMLDIYGLKEFKNNYPNELSGGMRQRVALIRTLAVNPNILLLDEPFAALDYQTKLKVCDDMYKIIKKENKSTIIVTHDITEAISIADKVIVLSQRPASIKNIYNINLTIDGERTPFKSRSSKEFKDYFNAIWEELNNSE